MQAALPQHDDIIVNGIILLTLNTIGIDHADLDVSIEVTVHRFKFQTGQASYFHPETIPSFPGATFQ